MNIILSKNFSCYNVCLYKLCHSKYSHFIIIFSMWDKKKQWYYWEIFSFYLCFRKLCWMNIMYITCNMLILILFLPYVSHLVPELSWEQIREEGGGSMKREGTRETGKESWARVIGREEEKRWVGEREERKWNRVLESGNDTERVSRTFKEQCNKFRTYQISIWWAKNGWIIIFSSE